jgi:hypothetical protein
MKKEKKNEEGVKARREKPVSSQCVHLIQIDAQLSIAF